MKKNIFPSIFGVILFLTGCSTPSSVQNEPEANEPELKQTLFQDGEYELSITESKIMWVGRKVTGQHEGTIMAKAGKMKIEESQFLNGEVEMDMATIGSTDLEGKSKESLDTHLQSEDFFNTKKFPTAKFTLTNLPQEITSSMMITGELTIKDKTNPISINMETKEEAGEIKTQGSFVFDRTLWDIQYGSGKFFQDLGDKMISDEIEINFQLNWKKSSIPEGGEEMEQSLEQESEVGEKKQN